MNINKFWLRAMGVSGILGGLLLFTGDMLFYYNSNSTDLKLNMSHVSDFRIMASGISALLATWLYILGLGQVYYAFKSTSLRIRNTVLISFAGILIAYGVVHGVYVAIATTAKLAVENGLDIEIATTLASKTNNILRLFVYPLFALLSYVFISQVWKKNTLYPRWILFFFPLLPFLFKDLISRALGGSLWIIIVGGFLNLILVVFFLASTIALWNPKKENYPK
jgi:hypothetical protein